MSYQWIIFASSTSFSVGLVHKKCYCNYTTSVSLLPGPYFLNVHVESLQLPNYLRSSEGMDRYHRSEKNCEDKNLMS